MEALWTKAVDQLSEEDKQQIDVLNPDRRGLIQDVIKVVEGKHQSCIEKQWKFRTGSEIVPTRDPLGRIVAWINKFRDVGTIMMQYDPAHAAIPWAAIRFVLEVSPEYYHASIVSFLSDELTGSYERFRDI